MKKIVEILKAIIKHSKSEVVYRACAPELVIRSTFTGATEDDHLLCYNGQFEELISDVECETACLTHCSDCEHYICPEENQIKEHVVEDLTTLIDENIEYLTQFKKSLKTFKI